LWRWIRSFIVKNSLPYGVKIFLPNDVKKCLTFASFLPQDYCYNRTNMGIKFSEHAHVLEYIDVDCYRLLGENYPYTGLIIHKPKGFVEIEVGRWENGESVFFDERYS